MKKEWNYKDVFILEDGRERKQKAGNSYGKKRPVPASTLSLLSRGRKVAEIKAGKKGNSGKLQGKSSRGGKKNRQQTIAPVSSWCKQNNEHAVIVPTSVKLMSQNEKYGAMVQEELKQLVGCSDKKVQRNPQTDALKVLMALETGNDPMPYFDVPSDVRGLKVLVTADISGSCQSFSDLTQGFAITLSKFPEVEVKFALNSNGYLCGVTLEESIEAYKEADIVLYFGDEDCYGHGLDVEKAGATFIAFMSYRANYCDSNAHVAWDVKQKGRFLAYEKCNINNPHTIIVALRDAIQKLKNG